MTNHPNRSKLSNVDKAYNVIAKIVAEQYGPRAKFDVVPMPVKLDGPPSPGKPGMYELAIAGRHPTGVTAYASSEDSATEIIAQLLTEQARNRRKELDDYWASPERSWNH